MNKLTIYLDFEGTVVEQSNPNTIGRCNFGCMEIIKKLQLSGHKVVLNSYRSELNDGSLEKALDILNKKAWMLLSKRITDVDFELDDISALPNKVHAPMFDIDSFIENGIVFIDDNSNGIPLKPSVMSTGKMVDWASLDAIFEEKGMYI